MKKMLAIVLALSMALSLGTAFASETPTYQTATATVAINSQLLQMMTGGGDETLDAVLSIINKLEIVALEGDHEAVELYASVAGGKALSLNGTMTEGGYLLTSALFPSYAILIDNETLAELMASVTPAEGAEQPFDLTPILEMKRQYVGAPETGAYTVNGKEYATKVPASMDGEAIMALIGALAAMLPEQIDMSSFPNAAEANVLLAWDSYLAADGSAAYDVTLSEEGVVQLRLLIEAKITGENACEFSIYMPQGVEFEAWETAVAALSAGEDLGYSVTGSGMIDNPQAPTTAKLDVVIFNGGQYMFGLKLDAAETGVGVALTMMSPDMPFITANIVMGASDTPAPAAVDSEGLTVVDAKALYESINAGTELWQAVQADMQYGITTLLVNLIQLAPDEMTVIMNAMNPPVDETTTDEAPVVPVDEAPAVPAA